MDGISLYGSDMTPAERIADVERQMRENVNGRMDGIHCPYCGTQMGRGAKICCITMGKASMAVLRRWAANDVLRQAEQIAENVQSLKYLT